MNKMNKMNAWRKVKDYGSKTSAQGYLGTASSTGSCGASCGADDGEKKFSVAGGCGAAE